MSEALVCDYARTPIGRFGGALSQVRADDLAAVPLRALVQRNPGIDPEEIDEVILGCANQAGEDNRNVARMALLLAGLPVGVPGLTVNRLCASGMDAVIAAARAIAAGEADIVLAGGVESMSRAPFVMPKATAAFSRNAEIYDTTIGWRFVNPSLRNTYGIDSMPETAENVAAEFDVSRGDQDEFALHSQEKAATAIADGRLASEIVSFSIPRRKSEPLLVEADEHPRATTLDKLAALPTPFRQGGTVTAGNSSGVNDGAAALLLASEEATRRLDLVPFARIAGSASCGVSPRIMGVGPVPAVRKLCNRLGANLDDFDVIELNEAFASQSLAVMRELGLEDDDKRVNPNGGAIALGHPLGMSGARITGTAALELHRRGGGRSLSTMCVGVGQGVALALEAV
ncbi:MAG: 3-oxoadipyl-CoA thiolase [Albidovulum sp.]|nr:3-oxoadipyl-CoA thiolase [Albidovulum sp.]